MCIQKFENKKEIIHSVGGGGGGGSLANLKYGSTTLHLICATGGNKCVHPCIHNLFLSA